MGLLDTYFSNQQDPTNQGLLNAAAAMFEAGGASRLPISIGQALGRGMLAGSQGYDAAQQNQIARQEQAMKFQQAKDAMAQQDWLKENSPKFMIPAQAAQPSNLTDYYGAITPQANAPQGSLLGARDFAKNEGQTLIPATPATPASYNSQGLLSAAFAKNPELGLKLADMLKKSETTTAAGSETRDFMGNIISSPQKTEKYGDVMVPISGTHEQMFSKKPDGTVDMTKPIGQPRPFFNPNTAPPDANTPSSLKPEATQTAAFQHLLSGNLPSNFPRSVRGRMSPEARDIVNASADLQQEYGLSPQDVALLRANNKALAPALSQLQKQSQSVESFQRTLVTNLDEAKKIDSEISKTGSPWLNKPLISILNSGVGDPKIARLNVRVQAIRSEVGKIMSGSMGNVALSDQAQRDASKLISMDMPLPQFNVAADEILSEVQDGRVAGMKAQERQLLQDMLPTLRSGGTGSDIVLNPSSTTPNKSNSVVRKYNPVTGKIE